MANITPTNLTFGATHNASGSTTTSSVTPGSNQLVLVTVLNAGTSNTPTISGNGMTWVQVGTSNNAGRRITVFRGLSISPSAGIITITCTGTNDLYWSVDEFANVNVGGTNGSNAVVQSVFDTRSTSNNISESLSLSTFKNTKNMAFGIFTYGDSNSITKGASFTELTNATLLNGLGGSQIILEGEYATNQTTVNWTATSTGGGTVAAFAVEISVPVSGFFQFF